MFTHINIGLLVNTANMLCEALASGQNLAFANVNLLVHRFNILDNVSFTQADILLRSNALIKLEYSGTTVRRRRRYYGS